MREIKVIKLVTIRYHLGNNLGVSRTEIARILDWIRKRLHSEVTGLTKGKQSKNRQVWKAKTTIRRNLPKYYKNVV